MKNDLEDLYALLTKAIEENDTALIKQYTDEISKGGK